MIGAKAKVLHGFGFVCLVAVLVILLKLGHFVFHFSVRFF
jgi:hypothetical protein